MQKKSYFRLNRILSLVALFHLLLNLISRCKKILCFRTGINLHLIDFFNVFPCLCQSIWGLKEFKVHTMNVAKVNVTSILILLYRY